MSIPNLTSLLKQSQIVDHEEVLRAANAALKSSKTDLEVQHVKVIALLKLDRYEDAARTVEAGGEKLKETARLEYAYALYKSGKRKQAAEIAQNTSARGLQHVEAQALYGLEDFVHASELYRELSKEAHDDNVADLRVNTLAVNAQLEWNNLGRYVEEKAITRADFEAHETVYNTACASIAKGEFGQSEVLLKRARSLCENLQDLSEEEQAAEMLPITVQQIYVLTRLGRQEEAQSLSESIDASKVSDAVTKYLIKVNSAAATTAPGNPFLLERQLGVDLDKFEPNRPFKFQTSVVARNRYALDLGAMKFEGTASTTQSKISESPTTAPSTHVLSVANAAAHAKNQVGKEALKHIVPLLERRPNDIGLLLTVVQLYVMSNNYNSAVELLQKFLTHLEQSDGTMDVRFAPGLVGSIVSLYSKQGREEQARSELGKAASHWLQRSEDFTSGVSHLLKAAGSALLESQASKDISLARSIFEELYNRNHQDKYAAAGLLAASSGSITSVDKSALTTIDKLTAGVDVDALESSGIAQKAAGTPQQSGAARKRPAPSESAQPKAKKVRKSKLPKDYDPAKTPDAERWLPLRDRSTYRPKGKKGKARQAMLSQGAVLVESDGSRPATPGGEVIKNSNSSTNAMKNKKKKAKGKK